MTNQCTGFFEASHYERKHILVPTPYCGSVIPAVWFQAPWWVSDNRARCGTSEHRTMLRFKYGLVYSLYSAFTHLDRLEDLSNPRTWIIWKKGRTI